MPNQKITKNPSGQSRKISLRLILIVPFVLQIFAAVGLTGWLSLRNGQEAVNNVAAQLRREITDRIKERLNVYLTTPELVNKINAKAIERADQGKLRQVLINLLNNALKFTQEGGVSVRVQVKAADNSRLDFEVEDTGPGIAPEEIDSIFEAFVQTATGKQSQEGTGLGLPITRKFVELMGGSLRVSSEVGSGTIFKFDIEVTVVESADIPAPEPTRHIIALDPDQPTYRILIVDDKWTNRKLLLKLLSPLGFKLQEASNGQEAIERWDSFEPHLIWMDMRMPVMNGYEATKHIKASVKGQATAIIALTASILEEERAIVLDAGCDDFVRKPFRETEIFEKMSKHIGVRYVYSEPAAPAGTSTEAVTSSDLLQLPRSLLAQVENAVLSIDLEQLDRAIALMANHNAAFAQKLSELAYQFEYDEIIALIKKAQDGA